MRIELAFKVIVAPYKKLTSDKVKDTENETFTAIKLKTSDFIITPSINNFTIDEPFNILTRLDTGKILRNHFKCYSIRQLK